MSVTLPTIDPNVTTAVAAAGGAILIKIVEKWIGRRNENSAEAERIRKELRAEITRYRDDKIRLEKEVDTWRLKYWEAKSLHESDELRINDLESEVSYGTGQIQILTDTLDELTRDVRRLQTDE